MDAGGVHPKKEGEKAVNGQGRGMKKKGAASARRRLKPKNRALQRESC